MNVQHVPLEWVVRVWPRVQGWLARAYAWSRGDYTVEQAQLLVASGQWVLFVVTDAGGALRGAATVHMYNRPTARVAFVTGFGGSAVTTPAVLNQFRTLVRGLGATTLEAAARPAMTRLLRRHGFDLKHHIVGAPL